MKTRTCHAARKLFIAFAVAALVSFIWLFFVFNGGERVFAQASNIIKFQGKIVSVTSGTNLLPGSPSCVVPGTANDTCDFRASLYSESTGGTLLWQESHTNVEIESYNGVFNLPLGNYCSSWGSPTGSANCTGVPTVTGVDWSADPTIYLQIEFSPAGDSSYTETFSRFQLGSTPFSMYSAQSGGVVGGLDTVYGNDTDKSLLVNAASGLQFLSTSAGNISFDLQSTGNFVVLDGGNPALIVNSNGDVGIGTATPTSKLEVVDNRADFAGKIRNSNTGASSSGLQVQLGSNTPGEGNEFLQFRTGSGSAIGGIQGNSNGGVIYSSSGSGISQLLPGTYSSFSTGDIVGIDGLGNALLANPGATPAGVFSSTPAFIGNWAVDWRSTGAQVPVALAGRLPVKVNTSAGAISMNDWIAVSATPGVGRKSTGKEMVVGRALQAYAGAGTGIIQVDINIFYFTGTPDLDYVYAEDADKTMVINNSAGLKFDMVTGGGNFSVANNGTDFFTFNNSGSVVVNGSMSLQNNLNMNNNQLLSARLENLSSAPTCSTAARGRGYYNISDSTNYFCDGVGWIPVTAPAGGGGDLDSAYGNDANKQLNVNSATGLQFLSSSPGNIYFNLMSTGDFEVGSGSNPYLTVTGGGNVGIGTSTPQAALDIYTTGTAAAPSLIWQGDSNTGIFRPAADTIAFSAGGAEQVRLTTAGLQLASKTADPTAPAEGTIWFRADSDNLMVNADNRIQSIRTNAVAQVYQSTSMTINTADTAIPWDGTSVNARFVDSTYAHSTTVNSSRLTVNDAGLYRISYGVTWDNNANAAREVTCRLVVNGTVITPEVGSSRAVSSSNQSDLATNSATFFYSFNAADYYQIYCANTSTSTGITTIANTSWTAIELIRRI